MPKESQGLTYSAGNPTIVLLNIESVVKFDLVNTEDENTEPFYRVFISELQLVEPDKVFFQAKIQCGKTVVGTEDRIQSINATYAAVFISTDTPAENTRAAENITKLGVWSKFNSLMVLLNDQTKLELPALPSIPDVEHVKTAKKSKRATRKELRD
ncbi:hypothetical protein [Phyllobacterium sp. OV277]|uniref:hypothetical protein n=1 Tax=Phyllobacterium sp. OV277 TaxID=1882772 RepID=UPI00088A456A|nr:hypothetical protein [Phyllobacterium sp. OV277]SDP07905.1 hypothetical protein SAMN05443582_103345 [Phyllobacterium sp. OV277]